MKLLFCSIALLLSIIYSPIPAFAQFIEDGAVSPVQQQPASDPFGTAIAVVNFIFAIAFVASLIGFIIAVVRFIIAGGSEGMLSKANATWIASLIGLIVSLVGFIIINIIKNFLR
jgi:hypothetical protein